MGPKAKPEKKKEIPEAMTEPRNLRNRAAQDMKVSTVLQTTRKTRSGKHGALAGEANPHNVTTNEPVPLEVNTPNIPQGLSEGNSLDMDVQAEPTSSTHNNAEDFASPPKLFGVSVHQIDTKAGDQPTAVDTNTGTYNVEMESCVKDPDASAEASVPKAHDPFISTGPLSLAVNNPPYVPNVQLPNHPPSTPVKSVFPDRETASMATFMDMGAQDDTVADESPSEQQEIFLPCPTMGPAWIADGEKYMKDNNLSMDEQLPWVSAQTLLDLNTAEQTEGGLKHILAAIWDVALKLYAQSLPESAVEDDDDDINTIMPPLRFANDQHSHSLLECIRRMKFLSATFEEAKDLQGKEASGEAAAEPIISNGTDVPPGGVFNVNPGSGKEAPTLATLLAEHQYSNADYWKYAPYLDADFRASLETLYTPDQEGRYRVTLEKLKEMYDQLEEKHIMSHLAQRHRPTGFKNTEPLATPTILTLELDIVDHLRSQFASYNSKGFQKRWRAKHNKVNNQDPTPDEDCGQDQEYDEDAGEDAGSGKKEILNAAQKAVCQKWVKQELNPQIIKWGQEYAKDPLLFRQEIFGQVAVLPGKRHAWNLYQPIWWHGVRVPECPLLFRLLQTTCSEDFQAIKRSLKSAKARHEWFKNLEQDAAKLAVHSQRNPARNTIDMENAVLGHAARGARDHIHFLIFAFDVNPQSQSAQAMSGIGVSSSEMRTVLEQSNDLAELGTIFNDYKNKLGELERNARKAGKLPPLYGDACMINLDHIQRPSMQPLDFPSLSFKTSGDRAPETTVPAGVTTTLIAGLHARQASVPAASHVSGSTAPKARGRGAGSTKVSKRKAVFPTLPDSPILRQAISRVSYVVPARFMREAPASTFKLLAALLEPKGDPDINFSPELPEFFLEMWEYLRKAPDNRLRDFNNLCKCVVQAVYDNNSIFPSRGIWGGTLNKLARSKTRLINWSTSIPFPTTGNAPNSSENHTALFNMMFNTDPMHRLYVQRLGNIEIVNDTILIVQEPLDEGSTKAIACTRAGQTVTVQLPSLNIISPITGGPHGSTGGQEVPLKQRGATPLAQHVDSPDPATMPTQSGPQGSSTVLHQDQPQHPPLSRQAVSLDLNLAAHKAYPDSTGFQPGLGQDEFQSHFNHLGVVPGAPQATSQHFDASTGPEEVTDEMMTHVGSTVHTSTVSITDRHHSPPSMNNLLKHCLSGSEQPHGKRQKVLPPTQGKPFSTAMSWLPHPNVHPGNSQHPWQSSAPWNGDIYFPHPSVAGPSQGSYLDLSWNPQEGSIPPVSTEPHPAVEPPRRPTGMPDADYTIIIQAWLASLKSS